MYFEIAIARVVVDKKGNDRSVTEKWFVDKCELFGEAELKGIELYPNNADVVAIKISSIKEFINQRTSDEQAIFVATIESVTIDENEVEKSMRYKVALFAKSIQEATSVALKYMQGGLEDMTLIGMKRTKFIDIL